MDLRIGASRLLRHLEDSLVLENSSNYGGGCDSLRKSAFKLDFLTRRSLWLLSCGETGCCGCFGKSKDVWLSKAFRKTSDEELEIGCTNCYREDSESEESEEFPPVDSFGLGLEISPWEIEKPNKASINSVSNFQHIKDSPPKSKPYLNKQVHSTEKLCSKQDPSEVLQGRRSNQMEGYHQVRFNPSPFHGGTPKSSRPSSRHRDIHQDQDVDSPRLLAASKLSKNIWRPWMI